MRWDGMLVLDGCAGMIKGDEGYEKWRVRRRRNPMRAEAVRAVNVDIVEYCHVYHGR